MKHKFVITGNQRSLIENLYLGLETIFDCITSSTIVTDLERHIQMFNSDVLIVCLDEDIIKNVKMMSQIRWVLNDHDITVVVIGAQNEIEAYTKAIDKPADIYFTKPIKNSTIVETLTKYLDEREKEREEKLLREQQKAEELKKHILIVDDDPNMLELLKEHLEGDYRIATAVNGGLALRFLTKKTTDLILLDYEMPVQNGPQFMSIIRNNESTKDIPIVFLTGIKDAEKIKKVLELKPQGYLLKPIDLKKLDDTIAGIFAE